jgi:hypothetical protein
MPVAKLEDVPIGAVLARPVEDSMGRVLINAGEPLTEQLLAVLRKRGYAEVDIRPMEVSPSIVAGRTGRPGASGPGAERNALEEEVAAIRQRIAKLFGVFPSSNLPMANLRGAVESVLVERLMSKNRNR